jgi:hypothetical protein
MGLHADAAMFAVGAVLLSAALTPRQAATFSNVAGFLATSNAQNNDLAGEWQETVLVRNAKGFNTGSTLFGLMSRLKSENADNMTFNWWERNPTRINFYSDAGYASGVTTIGWNDGASTPAAVWQLLDQNAVLLNNRTGERVRVAATPGTAAVTVARGIQGTSAAAINAADLWTLITLAKDEGANPVRAAYEQPTAYQNCIQTFNESVLLTNAYKAGVLRTDLDGPLMEQRAYALEKVANKIELAYFLGINELATGTNGTIYYTGGVQNAIDASGLTANALNGGGSSGVTLDAFKAWLQSFMVFGSDVKLAFCGPTAYAAISNYANTAAGGFRIMNQETVFGMNITNIVTPYGELSLAFHPIFQNAVAYNGYMAVIDLQLIVQKVVEPLFLEPNIQLPGQDSYQEQFRAKLGLKLKFPAAFGYAINLQKITAT